jgi:hypothetical protein
MSLSSIFEGSITLSDPSSPERRLDVPNNNKKHIPTPATIVKAIHLLFIIIHLVVFTIQILVIPAPYQARDKLQQESKKYSTEWIPASRSESSTNFVGMTQNLFRI